MNPDRDRLRPSRADAASSRDVVIFRGTGHGEDPSRVRNPSNATDVGDARNASIVDEEIRGKWNTVMAAVDEERLVNSMELELQLRKDHASLGNGLVLSSLEPLTEDINSAADMLQLINDNWDWLMSSLDQSGTDEWLPVEVEHQEDFAALMTAIHAAQTSRLVASGPSLMEQAKGFTAPPAAWGQELPRLARLRLRLAEELELRRRLQRLVVGRRGDGEESGDR
ncbi:hypothetical protein CLOM_g21812 [Closterium sp. NIES-68]|nr:hypothetical protein CLOM_g21812 [Closterium sp. NIES-68]GJP84297.1 hypothetical protein CLOP_g14359 [Closterium sp. NIES-67]